MRGRRIARVEDPAHEREVPRRQESGASGGPALNERVGRRIPAIREMTDAGRAWHRAWVERTFAPLLAGSRGAARERRLVALIVATDILVWKLLRREMELDRATAERIVIEMITTTKGAP